MGSICREDRLEDRSPGFVSACCERTQGIPMIRLSACNKLGPLHLRFWQLCEILTGHFQRRLYRFGACIYKYDVLSRHNSHTGTNDKHLAHGPIRRLGQVRRYLLSSGYGEEWRVNVGRLVQLFHDRLLDPGLVVSQTSDRGTTAGIKDRSPIAGLEVIPVASYNLRRAFVDLGIQDGGGAILLGHIGSTGTRRDKLEQPTERHLDCKSPDVNSCSLYDHVQIPVGDRRTDLEITALRTNRGLAGNSHMIVGGSSLSFA